MLWAPSSITRSPANCVPGIVPKTVLLTTFWRYLWPVPKKRRTATWNLNVADVYSCLPQLTSTSLCLYCFHVHELTKSFHFCGGFYCPYCVIQFGPVGGLQISGGSSDSSQKCDVTDSTSVTTSCHLVFQLILALWLILAGVITVYI